MRTIEFPSKEVLSVHGPFTNWGEGDAGAVSPSTYAKEEKVSYEAIRDLWETLVEENTNELEFLFAENLLGEIYSTKEVASLNIYGEKGGGRLGIKKDPSPQKIEVIDSFRKIEVHRETKKAWLAMVGAGRAAGHKHPLLMPTSGYRSTARQAELWKEALKKYGSETEARKWVAKPGGSAHHSGRALDLYLGTRNNKESVAIQRSLPVYHWLKKNASSFGFYPYDAEPWHWEHNPISGLILPSQDGLGAFSNSRNDQLSRRVELNRKFATQLNWIRYYSQINDLLLQTIGAADMSLGEEAFAEAVMEWQRKNGFSADQVDGIIGPNTWKKMKTQLPEVSRL